MYDLVKLIVDLGKKVDVELPSVCWISKPVICFLKSH